MAFIHHGASLVPSKLELLGRWLPTRTWSCGVSHVEVAGAYRFDDPAGEVGIETLILDAGGFFLQVPLTYRAIPLPNAHGDLIAVAEHTELGTRWVYDGCADPVWATELVKTVLSGGEGARQEFEVDGVREVRPCSASVRGSGTGPRSTPPLEHVAWTDDGSTTEVRADDIEIRLHRVPRAQPEGQHRRADALTGTWANRGPAVLAEVRTGSSAPR